MAKQMAVPSSAPAALLSTENAARYLGLSARTLNNWRWLGGGRGPAFVRLGLDLTRFRGRPTRPSFGAEVAHGIEQEGGAA